jgi:signal transduction histidine kinase
MQSRYDQALRTRIDSMLSVRAGAGEPLFQILALASAWHEPGFRVVLAICVVRAIVAPIIGIATAGSMDRTVTTWGFFFANTIYAIALTWACDFSSVSMLALPLLTVFHAGFAEGDIRSFVVASMVLVGGAGLVLGGPPIPIAAMLALTWLIHWFSEGRAHLLNEALDEVKAKANDVTAANDQLQVARQELEKQHGQLKSSFDQLQSTHERLIQVDKMVAIGQLAAGIAHEINNPLAVILGFAQGIARRVDASSGFAAPIQAIVREAFRCKELVQELLVFSRTGSRPKAPVEIEPLLRATAQLLDPRARAQKTELALELDVRETIVTGNRTQIQQIIVNLTNNALDALGEGGHVTIRTLKDGDDGVQIEVVDDGPGIPDEIKNRIFDPFFTTKDVGVGTGLGLSLVFEMVEKHGGRIDVESSPGAGTTMRVHLPLEGQAMQPSLVA